MAEFRIDFLSHAGEVLMVFTEPYKFISMKPAFAREVAQNLLKIANDIEPTHDH